MPFRVLVVPDKFKGTLNAHAAAEAIAAGWRQMRPDDVLDLLPMTDGGDGFGEVLAGLLKVEARSVVAHDPAQRSRNVTWWWDAQSATAIIESAQVIGLALLPPKVYHPFDLDTGGLATVVKAAHEAGAKRCLMGIGGSATNDAGYGLARALGWRFAKVDGAPISRW